MSKHSVIHVGLPSADMKRSCHFYSELFGWDTQHLPDLNYATFEAESGPGGGFPQMDDDLHAPNAVLIYVSTDDIDASLAHAERLGGSTVLPKTEIPGDNGWFAVFSDLYGNRVALFNDSQHPA